MSGTRHCEDHGSWETNDAICPECVEKVVTEVENSAASEIQSPKEAAVENWRSALDELEGETEDERTLINADIHDHEDRMEMEEIIQHGDVANGSGLEDAFHELKTHFSGVW